MQENINLRKYEAGNATKTIEKIKDWYIQGFQVQKVYQPDWEEVKKTFALYKLNLTDFTPTFTLTEVKNVRLAKELTETLITEKRIREWVIHGNAYNTEAELKGRLFMVLIRLIPNFQRICAEKELRKFLDKPSKELRKAFELGGTIREIDKEIEKLVEDVIFSQK